MFYEYFPAYGEILLSILLKDRTTNKNIIWATNDYLELSDMYKAEDEISKHHLEGNVKHYIKPRTAKSYKEQNGRTKYRAEVFTPSWICNKQNNLIDEQWFGRKNVFNIEKGKSWVTNDRNVNFPNTKKKTWQDYVDARRMEITCGEAPYLVSLYDTVTGDRIELKSRIGLLDRKIRVVTENTNSEEEWLKWTERAFQSIYGYELQGDNLLLARQNLLYTFIDNVRESLRREPSLRELKKIATIISWNLWQMDGLTFCIPFLSEREEYLQTSIFSDKGISDERTANGHCRIKNWRSKTILEYRTLVEGKRHE